MAEEGGFAGCYAPSFRYGAARLACFAGKRMRVSAAPYPKRGSNSPHAVAGRPDNVLIML